MPGAVKEGHELQQPAIAFDQAMRRNLHRADCLKVGMRSGIEAIAKKLLYMPTAIFPRW
jgi:hypothetical protein